MLNRDENKENNINLVNVQSIFGNLLNKKSDKNPINLNNKIKNEYNEVTNLLKKRIKCKIKKRKPSPLKRFEKLIAEYFFGKNGKFTHLIQNLKTELIEKERKKEYELKEKISIGELTFLQNKSYDNCSLEREKEIKKYNLLKSTNFKKEKNYFNYEQIRIKSKRHKKLISQFSPERFISYSQLDLKNKNKIYSHINTKKVSNFIITTSHKLNPKTELIQQKKKNSLKGKNEIRNYSTIFQNINILSPKILNESNNTFITTSKLKNENNKLNSYKNENKKNQKQINTVTTSVNSGSNNSSNNNNAISTFKISKSSIKTSNFSTSQNNINNIENSIMSNSFYIKNAIANINLDNLNLKKNNKKNQISLLKVSNSEKQLLIPEYRVEKPFILNSYLNFNHNNIKTPNFDFPEIFKKISYKRRNNSSSLNRKSFNTKDFNYKLDNIISNGKEFSKSLKKYIKNPYTMKIQDILEKRKNKSLIQDDINKIKQILDYNIKKDQFIKSINSERIENDNKLIDITKKIKDNEILSILLNAKKENMKNLKLIKNKNIGNLNQKNDKNMKRLNK